MPNLCSDSWRLQDSGTEKPEQTCVNSQPQPTGSRPKLWQTFFPELDSHCIFIKQTTRICGSVIYGKRAEVGLEFWGPGSWPLIPGLVLSPCVVFARQSFLGLSFPCCKLGKLEPCDDLLVPFQLKIHRDGSRIWSKIGGFWLLTYLSYLWTHQTLWCWFVISITGSRAFMITGSLVLFMLVSYLGSFPVKCWQKRWCCPNLGAVLKQREPSQDPWKVHQEAANLTLKLKRLRLDKERKVAYWNQKISFPRELSSDNHSKPGVIVET